MSPLPLSIRPTGADHRILWSGHFPACRKPARRATILEANVLPISHNSDEIAVEKFITAVAARLANLHAPEPGEDDAARWTDERIAENLMRRTLRGDEIEVAAHCLLLYKRQAPRETLVRASTRF